MAEGTYDRGGAFSVRDEDIDLVFRLDSVGGIVCACGTYSETLDEHWWLHDDRPCCPACHEQSMALSTPAPFEPDRQETAAASAPKGARS